MSRYGRLLLALALFASVGVAAASPAGAAGGTSCKNQTGSATFKPGLPLTGTANIVVTATTKISGCKGGGVTGGTGTAKLSEKKASCAGLAKGNQTLPITETIKWNTKTTSTFTGTSKTGTGAKIATVTITGKVTKGTFKNLKLSTTISFKPNAGGCVTKPVTKVTISTVKPLVIK